MLRWFKRFMLVKRRDASFNRLIEARMAEAYSVGFLDGQASVIRAAMLPVLPPQAPASATEYRTLAKKLGFDVTKRGYPELHSMTTQGRA